MSQKKSSRLHSTARRVSHGTRRARLAFEILEERDVPAAAVTISAANALAFVANTPGTVNVSYAAGVYTITDTAEIINVTNNGTGTVVGSGSNTITVTNTTSLDFDLHGGSSSLVLASNNNPTTLHDSTGGGDSFRIGSGTAQAINGAVTIGTTQGTSTAVIDDTTDATARSVILNATSLTGLAPATINLTGTSPVTINGGSGGDTFSINNAGASAFPASIVAGSGNDVFKMLGTSTLDGGTLNGGGGINTLDYTGYTVPVTVNLAGGTATGTSGISNIQDVVPSDLTVSVSHSGNFTAGDAADVYSVVVSNAGPGPTSGAVTVTDTLPTGLSPTAADSGTINGWNVSFSGQTITATRSDALAAGASYPALTLTVSVANNAPSSLTNAVTVSGGGEVNTANDSASNPTTITTTSSPTSGGVTVTGTNGDDVLVVTATGPSSGTYSLNGAAVAFSNATSFTFLGNGGNDRLRIIYPTGTPFAPSGGTHFDGGTDFDTLEIDAGGQALGTVPGGVAGNGATVLTYVNVEATDFVNASGVGSFAGTGTTDRSAALAGLSADERYIQSLYLDVLGRAGSRQEIDSWIGVLSSRGQSAVANGIEQSIEARDRLVRSWYSTYLGRQANGVEELGWVNSLLQGRSEEAVLTQILASPEFYAHAQQLSSSGTADERYVRALYMTLLNRSPSDAEVAFQVGALGSVGYAGLAHSFLTSLEFRTDQLEAAYNVFLGRPSDPAAVGWLSTNLELTKLRVAFETSAEFYGNAQVG
jgi:hypothetical protein